MLSLRLLKITVLLPFWSFALAFAAPNNEAIRLKAPQVRQLIYTGIVLKSREVTCLSGLPGWVSKVGSKTEWRSLTGQTAKVWRDSQRECKPKAMLCSGMKCQPLRLAFLTPPVNSIEVNREIPAIRVGLVDSKGRRVLSHRRLNLRLRSIGQHAAALDGFKSKTIASGEASFDGLVPRAVGTIELKINSNGVSGGVEGALQVLPGAVEQLRFSQPVPTEAHTWRPLDGVSLELLDAWGNRVIQDNSTRIEAVLIGGSGSLQGDLIEQAEAGQIKFENLRYDDTDSFSIEFRTIASAELPTVFSASFGPLTPKANIHYAKAWDGSRAEGLTHVLPTPQIVDCQSSLAHLDQFVEYVRDGVASMPEGHKTVFLREMCVRDRGMHSQKSDWLQSSPGVFLGEYNDQGQFVPYGMSIWWENGVAKVRSEMEILFSALKNAGVTLDSVILTSEESISNWSLPGAEANWQAMQNDYRYRDPNYGLYGQSIYDLLSFHTVYPNVYDWMNRDHAGNYLEFNMLMARRTNHYYNRAIVDVILEHYPGINVSRYNHGETSPTFGVPDQNGHRDYLYSARFPTPPSGTAQATSLHGSGGQVFNPGRGPDGLTYPSTPFNRFRYYANTARTMRLSSDLPMTPWYNYSRYFPSIYLGEYFKELAWHALLAGASEFIYWNPGDHHVTRADDELLNNILAEFDEVIGRSAYLQPGFANLAAWTNKVMETCAQFDRGTFCRITPDLNPGDTVDAYIVSSNPLILNINGKQLEFPNRTLVEMPESVSQFGIWVQVNN